MYYCAMGSNGWEWYIPRSLCPSRPTVLWDQLDGNGSSQDCPYTPVCSLGTSPFTREEGSGNTTTLILCQRNVGNVVFTTLLTATHVAENLRSDWSCPHSRHGHNAGIAVLPDPSSRVKGLVSRLTCMFYVHPVPLYHGIKWAGLVHPKTSP